MCQRAVVSVGKVKETFNFVLIYYSCRKLSEAERARATRRSNSALLTGEQHGAAHAKRLVVSTSKFVLLTRGKPRATQQPGSPIHKSQLILITRAAS